MIIHIEVESDRALYTQIADGVIRAIASGEIGAGDRLPPGRELAASLDVNLETVQRAYRTLADRGVVHARVGRGTRVVDDLDVDLLGIRDELDDLIAAARRIDLPHERLLAAIERRWSGDGSDGDRDGDG